MTNQELELSILLLVHILIIIFCVIEVLAFCSLYEFWCYRCRTHIYNAKNEGKYAQTSCFIIK